MSGAYLNLEPKADGQLAVQVVYQGGFDETNEAHLTARHLLAHLDGIMERIGEPVHTNMPPQDAIDDVLAHQAASNEVSVESLGG